MELGYSKLWQEVLHKMTGSRRMSADAILQYFQPLHDWLVDFNTRNQVPLGWHSEIPNLPTQQ